MTASRLRLAQHAHGLQEIRLTVRPVRSQQPSRYRPYGSLQPLPVLGRPWYSISVDFVEHVPTSNGFTAILMVIDRVAK